MTASSLGYKYTVSKVDLSRDFHARVNIKKRRVRVFFKTLTSDSNINIDYIESKKCSPSRNLYISDRSRSLVENAFFGEEDYILLSSRVFTTRAKKFLVTDVFTTSLSTQEQLPLFYYHLLENFSPSLSDFANRELLTLEFVDVMTMQPVNLSEYYFERTTGKIYNNLENTYNENDGLTATLVRYSVKVVSSGSAAIYSYQELINNNKAFSQAGIADLDDWGNLLAGNKVYLLEDIPGNIYYRVTLPPGSSSYAYKEIAPSKIHILTPTENGLSNPWNVRISNGEFMSAVRNGEASYLSVKYYIAEFLNQTFNPYYPYKFIQDEEVVRVSSSLVKTARNVVNNSGEGFYIDIRVYNSSGSAVESAFTTDSTIVGTYTDSARTALYRDLVLSIDELGGFIEVDTSVPENRKILVSYYSESDEYDFTEIDFNPLNNTDILSKKVAIYLNPETLTTGSLSTSLHYLEIDRLGRVSYCSQAAAGGIDPATAKLLAENFDNQGNPTNTIYYDIESTPSGLQYRPSGDYSVFQEELSFIDKYSVETELSRIIAPSGGFTVNLAENPGFFMLADVQVGESEAPENSTRIDVKVRGGGLKESYDTLAKKIEPESQFYWDKELPYPAGTAFMIELPQSLLQENDGDYLIDQLRSIVGKHADYGSYQVVRSYGLDPVIVSGLIFSDVLSGIVISGQVQLVWTSYGEGTEYDILMSTNKDTDFTIMNPITIQDQYPTNSSIISGLYPNLTYYTYLEATKDGEVSTGPKVKFTTTAYDVDGDT